MIMSNKFQFVKQTNPNLSHSCKGRACPLVLTLDRKWNDIILQGKTRDLVFPLVYVFIHTVCALSCTLAVNVYVFYMYISDGVISFCCDRQDKRIIKFRKINFIKIDMVYSRLVKLSHHNQIYQRRLYNHV